MSVYLQSSDYANYGVPNASDAQVLQASSFINAYLQRPEGLIYLPDANGNPCYMENLPAMATLQATTSITPGQNVNVTVTGPVQQISLGSSQCGLVAVLDRTNATHTEVCIITNISGNTLTLANVQFSHSIGCNLEFGLCLFEECQMPAGRPLTNLHKTPVQIILAGQGRYGYPRRGNSYFEINEYNLLAAITKFGGPPTWEIFDQTLVGIDPMSGQVWAPAGILLAYYTEIRFSYIAGYTYASLPPNVKLACAQIIQSMIALPMNGAIQNMRAGDTAITRFASTYLSDDVKLLLEPYRTRMFV